MLPTRLEGARTHNLKSVSLSLRPGEVGVVTGVSGAGKSSLAIDTLYAEGQRRFVESFSPYARQFLERLERPPIDAPAPPRGEGGPAERRARSRRGDGGGRPARADQVVALDGGDARRPRAVPRGAVRAR